MSNVFHDDMATISTTHMYDIFWNHVPNDGGHGPLYGKLDVARNLLKMSQIVSEK